ncbi:MAG: hypothetical protein K0Q46_956 [Rhodococcus erythropolis]|jgi:hypothetical protein|nr:hypothetical protein [Rhodococcus erythropolis]
MARKHWPAEAIQQVAGQPKGLARNGPRGEQPPTCLLSLPRWCVRRDGPRMRAAEMIADVSGLGRRR